MLKNEETANTWISLKGLIQLKIAKFPIHTDTQIRKFTSQNSQIHTSHRQTNSQIHNLKQTNSQIHNLNRPNSHFTHTFQFTNSQHNLAKFTNSQLKMGQFTIHKKVFIPPCQNFGREQRFSQFFHLFLYSKHWFLGFSAFLEF